MLPTSARKQGRSDKLNSVSDRQVYLHSSLREFGTYVKPMRGVRTFDVQVKIQSVEFVDWLAFPPLACNKKTQTH
jgi:type II secretory pathway component PulM